MADAWCAVFVWKKASDGKTPGCITTDSFRRLKADAAALSQAEESEVKRLAASYRLFHWHLAFPEVFARGGFDVILGNPPWERVKLQEKEWFAERNPEIVNASNAAARKQLIEGLKTSDPALHQQFLADSRKAEGESHLMRNSGRYPLCGRGDINVYTVFAEGMRTLLNDRGRVGCVLPTGIATDDTTKFFFQDVVEKKSLASLFDFENRLGLFPAVDSRMKFCLFTSGRGVTPTAEAAEFVFFAHAVEDLRDPERSFTLSAEDIALLNPNTRTCPIFRSRRDAELAKAIYRRVPVLIREAQGSRPEENPWGIRFSTMFHMSNDSHVFRTREQLEADGWRLEGNIFRKEGAEYLPLYEGRMIHHFDHRACSVTKSAEGVMRTAASDETTIQEHANADFPVMPRYWVSEKDVRQGGTNEASVPGYMAFKDVTSATNERTFIAAVIPRVAAGHKTPLILPMGAAAQSSELLAVSASFVCDSVCRQKLGGVSLTFFVLKQTPVLLPVTFAQPCPWACDTRDLRDWILPRVLELSYTAWDLKPFAQDCGWPGPPFRWDDERRFLLRCELDAAFFHLYLGPEEEWRRQPEALTKDFPTPRHAVDYIMETFPIVKRKDEATHGEYRTKRVVLEIYDEMQQAMETGRPYQTRLDPPPADPKVAHPADPARSDYRYLSSTPKVRKVAEGDGQ